MYGLHDLSLETDEPTGKVRLAKWFQTMPQKQKAKIVKDVTQLVLARRTRMCNFLEYKGKLTLLHSTLPGVDLPPRRHQGCIQAICIAILRLRNRVGRQ